MSSLQSLEHGEALRDRLAGVGDLAQAIYAVRCEDGIARYQRVCDRHAWAGKVRLDVEDACTAVDVCPLCAYAAVIAEGRVRFRQLAGVRLRVTD